MPGPVRARNPVVVANGEGSGAVAESGVVPASSVPGRHGTRNRHPAAGAPTTNRAEGVVVCISRTARTSTRSSSTNAVLGPISSVLVPCVVTNGTSRIVELPPFGRHPAARFTACWLG